MNFQLVHEWLRDLDREIAKAASDRDRALERKMAAMVPGTTIRIRAPAEFKVTESR